MRGDTLLVEKSTDKALVDYLKNELKEKNNGYGNKQNYD